MALEKADQVLPILRRGLDEDECRDTAEPDTV